MELEKLKESYDREDQKRQDKLASREEEMQEQIRRKEKEFEAQTYQERQKLLQEYEVFRQREETAKKERELSERALQLEEERIRRKVEEAHEKIAEAERLKESFALKLKDEMTRYQLDFDRQHASTLASLKADRIKLDAEYSLFREKESQLRRLEQMESELKQSKDSRHAIHTENVALRKELELLKDSNSQLRTSHEALQSFSRSSNFHYEAEKRYSSSGHYRIQLTVALLNRIATIEAKSKEIEEWKLQKHKVDRECQKYKKASAKWQQECQNLLNRIEPLVIISDPRVSLIC